ncbi:MAG: class I SAM-dependent methyltransferase [Candidatus Aerophobetes bacterium]|nr:class I SAM-dependent methyltransferase [Candidatus Aerophobetes bacterium]
MEKGYQVVALSPDSYQCRVFEKNTQGKVPFYLSIFEEFKSQEKFDLVLMSESCQYISIEKGLRRCREILRPGGYLLVADYFKVKRLDEKDIPISGHSLEEYLKKVKRAGFKMINSEDITSRVSPTLDFGKEFLEDCVMPSLKIIVFTIKVYVPHLYTLGNFFLGKIVRRRVDKEFEGIFDSKLFARHRKYMIYLFQLRS